MIALGFIQAFSVEDFQTLADRYQIDTDRVQTEDDLAEVVVAKAKALSEAKLIQMLIKLAFLPFGYSFQELPADKPLVVAAERYGVSRQKKRPPESARPAVAKENRFGLSYQSLRKSQEKLPSTTKKHQVKGVGA
jgi:hypothetical protein